VKITLGSEVCTAPTGSAVFISAGVPHHNWNEAAELETHLEVLAPGSVGLRQLAQLTESQDAGGRPYTVVAPGADAVLELDGGMTLTPLVGRDQGSNSALIYLATLPTGAAGPELHIHEFDQFYLVLDGLLGVQIGLEEYTIGPRHIAILPAGVPHRQWNAGEAVERHLTILTPPPEHLPTDDKPWDVSVELRAGTGGSASHGAA
jgi:quercetin dioxygenase-like cupin family protein